MNEHVQTQTAPETGGPLFNPLSPDFIRDPYPHYARLRTSDPVHVTVHGAYLASRHAEVSAVLRDKRFGKDFVERTIRRYGPKIMDEPIFRSMSHWMLQQDPPDHTRLRGLVVKAFTARRVEDMRPRIQEVVDQTIDAVIEKGHMDLIEDFAFRLPVTIICDMLGIPEEHREVFYKGSRDGGRILDPVPMTPAEIAQANAGDMMAQMYFRQLFELRRRNPGDMRCFHFCRSPVITRPAPRAEPRFSGTRRNSPASAGVGTPRKSNVAPSRPRTSPTRSS